MDFTNPQFFCRAATGAPALNRGLALLAALADQSPASLDFLAGRLKLPKASVFRLLSALQALGAVRKRSDKSYEPLWGLRLLGDESVHYREQVKERMSALCQTTGCTVEWYEPAAEGMRLICQVNPETELRVQARPGYCREWGDECESVARIGYAFATEAPPPISSSLFVANGVLRKIPRETLQKMIAADRTAGITHDEAFNRNGVRRYAAAVRRGNAFYGALALAEVHQFAPLRGIRPLLSQLKKAARIP